MFESRGRARQAGRITEAVGLRGEVRLRKPSNARVCRPSAAESDFRKPEWRRVPAACGVGGRSYRARRRLPNMENLTLVARPKVVERKARNERRANKFFVEQREQTLSLRGT